jgi:PelA/Pel-15E family pectate lyase
MHRRLLPFAAALIAAHPLIAAVVGTNPPALPVTADRIAALPADVKPAWRDYLARSNQQRDAEQAYFAAELKAYRIATPTTPPEGRGGLMLNRPAEWFASDEARRVADNVLSFQTPAGGWSKNMNYADHFRQPGERFAPGNLAPPAVVAAANARAKSEDNDAPRDPSWHYVGTFDNNATITQLRFLARLTSGMDERRAAPYRAAVRRGLDYMLAAQFPNGGFPQVYPLEGGYHDGITYNDNAMVNVLELLRDIGRGEKDFAFLPEDARQRAAAAVDRGIACILASQIKIDGRRTVWCQQHDALTLAPASARNYEMPSQSGSESDDIMLFLMSVPNPSPEVVAAVHAAATWFQKTVIRGSAYRFVQGSGRSLVADPNGAPLWARYYEIGSDRPLFGDRDKSIHDKVDEISAERRNGYQWFGNGPSQALQRYAEWVKTHPATGG